MTELELIKELSLKENFNFQDLLNLVKILRSEHGCPWDREQTNKSVRNAIIDEGYEFIEGLDNDDDVLMCEELGDVLFQVIFHAQIKSEGNVFDIDDIINGICKKMVLRHPHVFGEVCVDNSEQVLSNWEKIKNKEKQRKSPYEQLDSVSKSLPSLMRASKIQSKAEKTSLQEQKSTDYYISQLKDTLETLKESDAPGEQLVAELLFASAGIARTLGLEAEEVLYKKNNAFVEQFKYEKSTDV